MLRVLTTVDPASYTRTGVGVIDINDESVKVLEATPEIVRTLVRGLRTDGWRKRPAPSEWSALEIVVHLMDVESHTVQRVRRILSEDHPDLPAWDHEVPPARAFSDEANPNLALREHAELRREHLQLLRGLSKEQWQRSAHHETRGDITLSELEAHVAAEEVDHLAQLARLL